MAVISSKDRIIPTKNQINYWNSASVRIENIEGAHYVFDTYTIWDELI